MSGSSGEKTEQPTAKKLRDARQKGQVAKSKEIATAAVIVGIYGYFMLFWDTLLKGFSELVILPSRFYTLPFDRALQMTVDALIRQFITLSFPVVILAMILGILSNYFQIGALFSFESIKPDLKKLNPVEGFKKIFSMNNLMELLKSIAKILFLGFLIYKIIKDAIDALTKIPMGGVPAILRMIQEITMDVAIFSAGAFILIAVLDHFLQKHQHIKKLKMTKDEVKREYKEMEGDPIIKGKRKQLHKELAMNDTVEKSRKASVIVTNPTRLAIALFYDEKEGKLPVILAKGEQLVARRIVEVAKEEGIPIMQNIPLARDLYEQGQVEHFIPSDLIEPVAEVLRWVQQLKNEYQ